MEPTRRSFLTTVAAAPFLAAAAPGRLPIKKAVEYSMIQPRTLSALEKFKIAKEAGFEEIECPTTPEQAKAEEILAASKETGNGSWPKQPRTECLRALAAGDELPSAKPTLSSDIRSIAG